ncbi:hypothetical protein Tco_0194881 [Tanacetum coccineum]
MVADKRPKRISYDSSIHKTQVGRPPQKRKTSVDELARVKVVQVKLVVLVNKVQHQAKLLVSLKNGTAVVRRQARSDLRRSPHRLCRPPSIPLSFGLATVLPRRSVSRVSWAPDPRRPRANTHRLRHGLPGRGFFLESCHDRALDERALQAALPFFTYAILLDRAFAHCPRFLTAVW